MALLWFGGVDRYETGAALGTTAIATATAAMPAYAASVPLPNMNGIYVRANGNYSTFNICELGNFLEASVMRKWLEGRSQSTSSSYRAHRYFEISLLSQDIPEKYKVPGTTICFGFRFRVNNVATAFVQRYLGFSTWTTYTASPTFATAPTANRVYPAEVKATHPLQTSTQEKYIEYRIKYRANNMVLIKIFINKDLMHEVELPLDTYWGIFAGSPRESQVINNGTASSSVFFNDFYMGVDTAADENPTDLIGPVTVKPLEMLPVTFDGEWKTSNSEKTINQTLETKLIDKRKNMTGDYVISDVGDRPAHFKFKPPTDEKLKIVAFQHDFIAQQPLAYSTSLQYARYAGATSLEEGGKPVTINVALEPNFSHVGLKAITHMPNGEDITADFIGSISLKLNSVKKFVPDDPDDEFEPPAAGD